MFKYHLAAARIAADNQSFVRDVLTLDGKLIDNQVHVRTGHEIRKFDRHRSARGAVCPLRGVNIRLVHHRGVNIAIIRIGRRLSRRRGSRHGNVGLHTKQVLFAGAKGYRIIGL